MLFNYKRYPVLFLMCLLAGRALAQYNLTEVGHFEYPAGYEMSGCWGYTDDAGNEYALIGTSMGTSILDISDPTDPVELFFVEGGESIWREIKVWNHHAYVSTEAYEEGMFIIDLNNLPASIDTVRFRGDELHPFNTAHTLFIDENGILYLFGYNVLTGTSEGAYMADLNPDPKNPVFLGTYNNFYIHDGFVRNDTMWAAEIYEGKFEVVDVSDKTATELIGTQTTGSLATHNCWLSDDGKYLFTTDEIYWGEIESYDVSDVSDIQFLDAVKHGHADSTVAHNTYYLNGYLITAHYSEGVTIHDVHEPGNMVEVGHYDTCPFGPEQPFAGVWGVYPYFESQYIIATDRDGGVFILEPTYQRAAYLEGTVKDDETLTNIFNATIELLSTTVTDYTNVSGEFKVGYVEEGIYDVQISAAGCETKLIPAIELITGETTILNVTLDCETIGINENDSENEVTILYHPEAQIISVQFATPRDGKSRIQLLNANGQLISDVTGTSDGTLHLSTGNCAPGCYYVSVTTGEFRSTGKIMVL